MVRTVLKMLGLPSQLRKLVTEKFEAARANHDLIFSDTKLAVLKHPPGPEIQLRYCPALSKKTETVDNATRDTSRKPFDPFEDPSSGLLVAGIPGSAPTHNLVLNKYPVIRNHFILATKANKPQTHLLEQDDLYLTFSCVQAWSERGDNGEHALYAFFNSGEHSGASQSHRHLQFLPVEDMKSDQDRDWQLLCTTATSQARDDLPLLWNPAFPFVHFATPLEEGSTAEAIHQKYQLLMRASLAEISDNGDLGSLETVNISQDGQATFSYNLAILPHMMAIMPRRKESSSIPGLANSSVAVNGTILAGTMMVKAESEWESLRLRPELVQHLLGEIAYSLKAGGRQNL